MKNNDEKANLALNDEYVDMIKFWTTFYLESCCKEDSSLPAKFRSIIDDAQNLEIRIVAAKKQLKGYTPRKTPRSLSLFYCQTLLSRSYQSLRAMADLLNYIDRLGIRNVLSELNILLRRLESSLVRVEMWLPVTALPVLR